MKRQNGKKCKCSAPGCQRLAKVIYQKREGLNTRKETRCSICVVPSGYQQIDSSPKGYICKEERVALSKVCSQAYGWTLLRVE